MAPRLLQIFANAVLLAYTVDGAVSLVHELTRWTALETPRFHLANVALGLSVLAIPIVSLDRRLPLRIFVPIIVSATGFVLVASFAHVFGTTAAIGIPAACVQMAIAVYAHSVVWAERGGWHLLFDRGWFEKPGVSIPRFLLVGTSMVAYALLAFIAFWVTTVVSSLTSLTDDFVRFDGRGVLLGNRVYHAGDRRVHLIGMMHIGEREGYDAIFEGLAHSDHSVAVLTEGVTDEQGLLEGELDYEGVAAVLGLEQQQPIERYVWEAAERNEEPASPPEFLHADVDVSDFGEVTVDWIGGVGRLYETDSSLSVLLSLYQQHLSSPQLMQIVMSDIVHYRNEHLLRTIGRELETHRMVVVPWGAMHMPGVAGGLEEKGFEPGPMRYVRLISWRNLWSALTVAEPASS